MSRWIVEFKQSSKHGWDYIEGIEAKDGKEAIEYVKEHKVIGAYKFKAWHDDEQDEEV